MFVRVKFVIAKTTNRKVQFQNFDKPSFGLNELPLISSNCVRTRSIELEIALLQI